MESRIVKQAREFCHELLPNMALKESQEFEIFSTAMLATTLSNKVDNEILKDIWLNDNISGIDGFFIIVDNSLYSISSYNILLAEDVKFKNVEFCFVEAKTSKSVDIGDILKFYNTLTSILERKNNYPKNIAECIHDFDKKSQQHKNITLKASFYFCTQKTESEIKTLEDNWRDKIETNEENIREFIEIKTYLIGSEFIRILKHHVVFIIFKLIILNTNFKKPKKMGDLPSISENEIEIVCNKINSLLSCREKFENLIKRILERINDTDLNMSNIIKTNQKILYSPITKTIKNFDDFSIQLQEYYNE